MSQQACAEEATRSDLGIVLVQAFLGQLPLASFVRLVCRARMGPAGCVQLMTRIGLGTDLRQTVIL